MSKETWSHTNTGSETAPRKPAEGPFFTFGKFRAADWGMNVVMVSCPDDLEKEAKQNKRILITPKDVAQGTDMWAVLGAFPSVAATMILPDSAAIEEFETGLGVSTKRTKALFLINGNVRMAAQGA